MNILQISDIHWTQRKHWDADFPGMKSRFLVDIKEYIEAGNEIDYVFICGDIAFKGAAEEYDKALKYIDEICSIIGHSRKEVFVVPGNHDLNRKASGYPLREMIDAALSFSPNNEVFFNDVVLKDVALRKDLYAAFADYNAFARNFLCQEEVMKKCIAGNDEISDNDKLFYHETLDKKVGDFNVSIRGVNTALNCDGWDWNEDYLDGHSQMLPRRAYVMEMEEKQEIRILMGHHPLLFLTSGEEVKEYLDSHYHIQLFGHVHQQYIGDGNCVMVQSGAFDPPKGGGKAQTYLPVYNIIEISQKDSTHAVVIGNSQIWERNKFVKNMKGCFVKEIEVERDANKWRTPKMETQGIDKRAVKFKFMNLDDRASYFDKVPGVNFSPSTEKSDYDNGLDFLTLLEKKDKLAELNKIMR